MCSAVRPSAVAAACATATVNQGGFSPEKDALKPVRLSLHARRAKRVHCLSHCLHYTTHYLIACDILAQVFSGELCAEDLTSLSVACGEAFKATAKVLSAPPQSSPTLPFALEILASTDAALSSTSGEAADLQRLRQALLGWIETPRLALATSWAQHEQTCTSTSTSGFGDSNAQVFRAMRGLVLFDLSSSVGREEILSFAKTATALGSFVDGRR
eukprot:COSAG02_NODE_5042_length_4700_cov_4.582790_2_plen_215_part_00